MLRSGRQEQPISDEHSIRPAPAQEMRASAEKSAEHSARMDARKSGPFGGLSPSEAARLRHHKERERKAATEQSGIDDELAEMVLVPIRVGKIITALESKSAAGDVHAARELRPWLDRYPPTNERSIDLATLTTRERDQVLARVLAELRELELEAAPDDLEAATEPVR